MTTSPSTMSVQLNAFQRMMYHWSELHPYNATHTCNIAGPLDAEKLLDAIRETYLLNGIGLTHIHPDGLTFRHEADSSPEVQVLSGGKDADGCLTDFTTRELNGPFERPTFRPMRFSVIDAGPQNHFVSLTYDHWIGDGMAARLVLRHVLGRYCDLPIPENNEPLDLYPARYRTIFGNRLRGLKLGLATVRMLRHWNRNRKAWQVALSSTTQMGVNYELYTTSPGTPSRLRQFARSCGATVNDVFLAAIGRAMSEFLPRRSSRGKSRDLALGTIVDTRSDALENLSNSFGTFLAYYLVRYAADRDASLAETVRRVAGITQPIKARQGYIDSLVNMKFINAVWPYLSETVKYQFLRKSLPMTAGISNVYLRDPWIEQNRDRILGYSRGAPTGPNVPLVLAPTTLGEQMNVGVTYRLTGFPRAKIDGVMEIFLDQLENPTRLTQKIAPTRLKAVPEKL